MTYALTALASFLGAGTALVALYHLGVWRARRQQRTLERAAQEWFATVAAQQNAKRQEGRHVQ